MYPVIPTFRHVKGHQDVKSDQPLTLPEQLNVDCDKWMAQVPLPCLNPLLHNNPMNNAAYPHLQVGQQIIIQQGQHQLRDATTITSYQEYLQNSSGLKISPSIYAGKSVS